jgi:hypothetical protein
MDARWTDTIDHDEGKAFFQLLTFTVLTITEHSSLGRLCSDLP